MTRYVLPMIVAVALVLTASTLPAAMSGGQEGQEADVREAKEEARLRLMPERNEKWLRGCLPKVADERVQKVLDDPRLIVYTDREMPKAYQFWDGLMPGVHRASYNISANSSEPFGNGNREFPWSEPAGTHRARNMWVFRFIHLPQDENGKLVPIVWFRTRLSGDSNPGYGWRFPAGAVVGEVLMMRQEGTDFCFELRVRFREEGNWAVDVFRPFPRAEDLVTRIQELRPDWEEQPALKKVIDELSDPGPLPETQLVDNHPRKTFKQTMGVHELPSLEDDQLVKDLLTQTVFRSALGEYWIEGSNGAVTAAPTTDARFHIVPAGYDAGFVDVDRISCMRCHESVNQPVSRFQAGRDWYGRIRGSDGIFSFHPFDPSCVSGNGYSQPVKMRTELVSAGVIEKYDPEKHDKLRYSQVPRLVE